jgi:hypothetical protein
MSKAFQQRETGMEFTTQIKADVPLTLKRQVFSRLALRGQFFNCWLREQMEGFVAEAEHECKPLRASEGNEDTHAVTQR